MTQIRLTKGLFALVDAVDYDWLMQWKWCASQESNGKKWYAIRREKGKKIRMHVEIVKRRLRIDQIPKGMVVDHVNNNSLDNRYEYCDNYYLYGFIAPRMVRQLEVVTQSENMRRAPGWRGKKKCTDITQSDQTDNGQTLASFS